MTFLAEIMKFDFG